MEQKINEIENRIAISLMFCDERSESFIETKKVPKDIKLFISMCFAVGMAKDDVLEITKEKFKYESKRSISKTIDDYLIEKKEIKKYKPKKPKIQCIETGEIFINQKIASEKLGINAKSINNNLRGFSKSSGGYHFRYLEE